MKYKKCFQNKKITMMGLGLLGRGVGVAEFLLKNGARVTITDLKSPERLASSIEQLRPYEKDIAYILGQHRIRDFENCDMVIKSAGVPLDSKYIDHAKKHKVPIEMDASLFVKLAPKGVVVVGVTGTRGKSTTTHLIYSILKKAGKRVYLGGNIRGVATLPLLNKVRSGDYVVLELDSWQLQGFGEAKISPHIAVFTTFMADHMNYYKNNMETNFADKANIFLYQSKDDFVVAGNEVAKMITNHPGKLISVAAYDLPNLKLKILGEHNLLNAALAYQVCKTLDIPEGVTIKSTQSFEAVEGRLQDMGRIKGITIYNDNNATTPEATLAGLRSLNSEKRAIILIMGGADKGLAANELISEIGKSCKAVVLISGSGTDKIKDSIKRHKNIQIDEVEAIPDVVIKAFRYAEKGDAVLFSPAFASFGKYFENEYQRNDQFVDFVNVLRHFKGVSTDSREPQKGKIFVAYRGIAVDSHSFIPQVISKGAIAIIGEQSLGNLSTPYFQVPNARLTWANLVAMFHRFPERKLKIIGVTGTDGKTTTSHIIYEILKRAGYRVGLISTVAAYIGNKVLDTGFHVTSPDPDDLWRFFEMAVKKNIDYLVLETTSHALDQDRYGDFKFDIGVLTNITHEHLDYHKTFENYRDTKAKLFARSKTSVLNLDDPNFDYIKSKAVGEVLAYSKTKIKITNPRLAGDYNKYNVEAAEAVAKILNVQSSIINAAVNSFSGVPGRLEEIQLGQKFRAIVDFAHTPNALEQVLRELKSQKPKGKSLILVFGCAGLRDSTKRPMMGDIAKKLSDKIIVTAEDPRTESLEDIYAQITSGKAGFIREDDRQQAINLACNLAKSGDIVVVTGKGHESSMCFGSTECPWSDQEAFKKAIKNFA